MCLPDLPRPPLGGVDQRAFRLPWWWPTAGLRKDARMRPELGTRVGDLYLRWALDSPGEAEAMLREGVLARLPLEIVDCHAHVNGRGAASDFSDYGWRQRRSSFPEWDLSSHNAVLDMLYRHRSVRTIWMPQPQKGIDHRKANAYILRNKPPSDFATLVGLPDDPDYTLEQIASGSYVALKMYPHYTEPPYTRIAEYFMPWALEAAAGSGMPIILHLPTPLSRCHAELFDLTETFPTLRVVLAHLGREQESTERIERLFAKLATHPGVVADMSMVTSRSLMRLALRALGADRLLYGSDEPFNLLRYVEIDDPRDGRSVVSHHDYHWNKAWARERYGQMAFDAPLVHFQALASLLDAVGDVFGESGSEEALHKIFRDNAFRVFPLTETMPEAEAWG